MFTGLLILLATTAPQAGDSPGIPAFFTGERLYEICIGEESGQCWMYVAGVLDGIFEAEASAGTRSICAARLTNRDAAERVTGFLRDQPQFRSRAAAVGKRRCDPTCDAMSTECRGLSSRTFVS
jgi:hypothetical protein